MAVPVALNMGREEGTAGGECAVMLTLPYSPALPKMSGAGKPHGEVRDRTRTGKKLVHSFIHSFISTRAKHRAGVLSVLVSCFSLLDSPLETQAGAGWEQGGGSHGRKWLPRSLVYQV